MVTVNKEARQKQIVELLQNKGHVEVEELCRMFNVTNMTVRRDLEELETAGLVSRSHGGAHIADTDILVEVPFYLRQNMNKAAKLAVAAEAIKYLADGHKIFIGSGTTTYYMSQKMDNSHCLITVTDAINIASELVTRPSISVIQLGGVLRSNTMSTTGSVTENEIRQFRFHKAFIGVTGIGKDGRLYVGSISQMSIYQAAFESAEQIIILADSSKVAQEDFVCIGSLSGKFTVITNKEAPEGCLEAYRGMGARVIPA
jgi:DeoR family transcriptional regulator, fructose operon transcriptional repressor